MTSHRTLPVNGDVAVSDPLTILRATHPDLAWVEVPGHYTRLLGESADGSIDLGYIDGAPLPEYGATVEVGGRRSTERGAAPIGVVAAELVDLRRSIGWPVGVSRD